MLIGLRCASASEEAPARGASGIGGRPRPPNKPIMIIRSGQARAQPVWTGNWPLRPTLRLRREWCGFAQNGITHKRTAAAGPLVDQTPTRCFLALVRDGKGKSTPARVPPREGPFGSAGNASTLLGPIYAAGRPVWALWLAPRRRGVRTSQAGRERVRRAFNFLLVHQRCI
jgi:hypothetical protein